MKKLLLILGFLMFATAVAAPLLAAGQGSQEQFSSNEEDVPYSSSRIFSKLLASSGANPDADWPDSFGTEDEEDVGKNLYLMIYDKTVNEPEETAFNNTAETYGLTTPDLIRVLHNDYTPLVAKKTTLLQEELQFKISEIQQQYQEQLETLALKASVNANTQPSEIFANGDVSDSGFDLINDLTIIEELLFLETHPIDIGNSYVELDDNGGFSNAPQAGGTADLVSPEDETRVPVGLGSSGGDLTLEGGENGPADAAGGSGSGAGSSGPPGTAGGSGAGAGGEEVNPAYCLVDSPYDDALAEFEDKKTTDPNYKDASDTIGGGAGVGGSGAGGGSDAENSAGGAGGGSGNGGVGTNRSALTADNEEQDFFTPRPPAAPSEPVKPAPADGWTLEPVCGDVLCLEINYVMKPAKSSFSNGDNCIACHAEKINDILKTVITHTLIPSKAPGNLGESAQCKKAVSSLFGTTSMNLYAIAMPIQTPLNDDLMFGTSIEEDWRRYCESVAYFPFDMCEPPADTVEESDYTIPPSLQDRANKQAIAQSPDGSLYDDVNSKISQTLSGHVNSASQSTRQLELEKTNHETTRFGQPILAEMDQMNRYFVNIRELLHSLHERVEGIVGKQACTDLKNKKECE